MRYLSVRDARQRPGLRLVLTVGVPGPWGEAAKALLDVKKVAYAPVAQHAGETDPDLVEWTGHRNAPIAVYGSERPRAGWAEILFLAERLQPEPRLIPSDPVQRAQMLGLAHELCGEQGLGWARRLCFFAASLEADPQGPARALASEYGYSPEAAAAAPSRCAEILGLLAAQLDRQRAAGFRFLMGESLSALDLFWAAFSNMVAPMPEQRCPMGATRGIYDQREPEVEAALDPLLLRHRDFVFDRYLPLPMDF